jgi:poly(hydroxyalkanoate) depolymerase family esterase
MRAVRSPMTLPGVRDVKTRRLLLAVAALAVSSVAAAWSAAVAAPASGFTRGTLDGRPYRLYVPQSAEKGARLPVVVALHGCWQTAEDFARGTRLNDVAERRHLLVLYPVQEPRHNATRCWNWFEPPQRERDEAAALLALVRQTLARPDAAADRVAVIGLSAGGFMAVNLVCAAPELFSGVGVAAGGPFRCGTGPLGAVECMRGDRVSGEASAAACRAQMGAQARPVRASLWHGEEDSVVSARNLEALVEMFRRLDGLSVPTVESRDGAVHSVFRDGRGRPMLESWRVPGMGHAWSGGDVRFTHTFPAGPDATERMLDFLLGPAARELPGRR